MPSQFYTNQKPPNAYAIQLYSGIILHVYALWQEVPKLLYAIRTSESQTKSKSWILNQKETIVIKPLKERSSKQS